MSELAIWTVRAYERPIHGRVTTTRYSVLAASREEAIALTKAHHEGPAWPECDESRYVAEKNEGCVCRADIIMMSVKKAEESIKLGLA